MSSFFNSLSSLEIVFLVIGFAGQGIFASRFVIQWIHSEKKGESSIPIIFKALISVSRSRTKGAIPSS